MYFAEIEKFFTKKRGRGLVLSPKDWQQIQEWQKAGIPLKVVLKGIDNAFHQKGSLHQEVKFLAYCHAEVKKAFKQYQEQMRGARIKDIPVVNTISIFRQRLRSIRQQLEVRRQRVAQAGPAWLEPILAQAQESINHILCGEYECPQLEAKLAALHQQLITECKKNMPAKEWQEIEQAVRQRLKPYQERMEKQAYAETLAALIEEQLAKRYQLPSLKLYEF